MFITQCSIKYFFACKYQYNYLQWWKSCKSMKLNTGWGNQESICRNNLLDTNCTAVNVCVTDGRTCAYYMIIGQALLFFCSSTYAQYIQYTPNFARRKWVSARRTAAWTAVKLKLDTNHACVTSDITCMHESMTPWITWCDWLIPWMITKSKSTWRETLAQKFRMRHMHRIRQGEPGLLYSHV